jgi:preprotein translocase SecE subunit
VARNRKRAKERRGRRPQPTVATARGEHSAPDPIAHATPDSELAEAQMALGRPELSDEVEQPADPEDLVEPANPVPGVLPPTAHVEDGDIGEQAQIAVQATPSQPGNRLINFLQGSWRELQRVQWPDRRQVMQATGVVIGFVIVAGLYLGAADWVAGKIVSFIIK